MHLKTQLEIMKTPSFFKNTLKLAFVASSLFFTSCSSDDNIALETTEEDLEEIEYSVTVNATNTDTEERTVDFSAVVGSTVPVIVKFTKEDDSMDRLYVTQNISGSTEGSVAYDIDADDALDIDRKLDGSLDLENDQEDEFTFTINFPAPTTDNATVQYILWTTEGRGDYRDITNDNSFEDKSTHAVITITAGTEAELSAYKEFEQTISLEVPSADGTSETFISVFNGEKYAISQGEETAALWDFGYFYSGSGKPSFYSSSAYSSTGFLQIFGTNQDQSVAEFAGASGDIDLNDFYFSTSSIDFDAVDDYNDLDIIVQSNSQSLVDFDVNDVIEFVDQYGNKGLIKIISIDKSFSAGSKVTFDVKVQANATPITAL